MSYPNDVRKYIRKIHNLVKANVVGTNTIGRYRIILGVDFICYNFNNQDINTEIQVYGNDVSAFVYNHWHNEQGNHGEVYMNPKVTLINLYNCLLNEINGVSK